MVTAADMSMRMQTKRRDVIAAFSTDDGDVDLDGDGDPAEDESEGVDSLADRAKLADAPPCDVAPVAGDLPAGRW